MPRFRLEAASILAVLFALSGAPAAAGPLSAPTAPAPAATPAPEDTGTAPDSPRASLAHYLELARAGKWADAARYLDLPPARVEEGPLLARRLKAVLDGYLWFDLAKIPNSTDGDGAGGQPAGVQEIGSVSPGGIPEPVRLVRRTFPEGARWLFSRRTLERLDASYEALPNHWFLENVPLPLQRFGPGHIQVWQWIGLLILVPIALGLGLVAGRLTRWILHPLVRRTRTKWDDVLLARLLNPVGLAWALVLFHFLRAPLGLYAPADALVGQILRGAGYAIAFWGLLRLVDVFREGVAEAPWATRAVAFRQLLPFASRMVKLAIGALGIVAALSAMGFPVASLLTGLGIGGVILALAAQKTVENLFGSFSIGVDQPFLEGDFIEVEGMRGTVERIGLRSTRVRTLDRTVVTIPNGKLADSRVESLTARDRFRFVTVLGFEYGTTAAQMRTALAGIEALLKNHPKVWPENVTVQLSGLGDSALKVDVWAWFQHCDVAEFGLIRQEILLGIMEVAEKAGASFAFPTTKTHVVSVPPPSTRAS